jgi:hypothetical protein
MRSKLEKAEFVQYVTDYTTETIANDAYKGLIFFLAFMIYDFYASPTNYLMVWSVRISVTLICFLFVFFQNNPIIMANSYYNALRAADRQGNAAPFVEFALDTLKVALEDVIGSLRPHKSTPSSRLGQAQLQFGVQKLSRKDYMKHFPDISSATASRDLAAAVADDTLVMSGEKALARYQFKKASS